MTLSPDHLIALLRARGIRVEVEELLRLHEALQHGTDWSPQRLENVIVGILATCPEDGPRIREAIRELRTGLEPVLAPGSSVKSRARARRVVGSPPLLSRRLVVLLGLGGVAAAAATVALLSRRREPDESTPEPTPEPPTPEPPTPVPTPEPPTLAKTDDPAPPSKPVEEPAPLPEPTEEPWITAEREKQEKYRATQAARREEEAQARQKAIAEIDATRTTRRVLVPRFVPKQTSWHRVIGAALLGPAMATGVLAWFAHRAWRRRSREAQRFGGAGLEVAPGPSLFWLAPPERRWPPLLTVEARETLVWGVGQAVSEERTRLLDLDATISATIEYGGLPELRFRHKRRLQRVWLWHDQSAAGPIAARLCAEVQQTLHGYGLAVEVGRFWGLPERLERDDGRMVALDGLDDEREFSTVLVLTDGVELLRQWEWRDPSGHSRQQQLRALLARLSGWPQLTIVHTGTRERLRALRALLEPFGIPCIPLEGFALAVREREHLLQTIGAVGSAENVWMWAALCAIYPLPVPEALALALLRHLDLPISPLSLGQLMEQSVTTAGIQFKPNARARLIERLRRALDDGSGGLPRPMQQALEFWRARTIEGDEDWAQDTSGRGLHRRLVVALLDVWTDPERAAKELSVLWKSPQMPAIREELARMRPTGNKPGAPEPGSFHVPMDPATLSPATRARLQAAGMGGLGTPEGGGSRRWPWWLRGVVVLALLMFIAGAALLVVDLLRPRTLAVDDSARWALARPVDSDRLLAHVAGEWRDVGTWPIAEDVELVTDTVEVKCTGDSGLRRCLADDAAEAVPARRIAILDAERDSPDAVRFADSLLDRGLVDAAWIGEWPQWWADRRVRALEGHHGLEVWAFTLDPDFTPNDVSDARSPRYPSILRGSTGRALAADFCGDAVCVVTASGDVAWFLRGDLTGTTITELRGHEASINAAALSPDGQRIVTASEDRTARVWNADGTGEPVLLKGHTRAVLSAGWSPDTKHIVTASADKTARVWSADGTGEPMVLRGHGAAALFAAFSPDGARIVTTSANGRAVVWKVNVTGGDDKHSVEVAAVKEDLEAPINAAAWSPDGARLVTVSSDMKTRVWQADGKGESVAFWDPEATVLSAAWSPDGQHILSGSEDNIAQLWDPKRTARLYDPKDRLVREMRHGVGPGIANVAFSPDGKYMLTASGAGTVRVWTADGRPVSARAERSEASLEGLRAWDELPSSRTLIYRSTDWRHLLGSFSTGDDVTPPVADGSEVAFAEVPQNPRALLVTGVNGPVTAATGIPDASINDREPDNSLLVGNQSGEVIRWVPNGGVRATASAHESAVAGFASARDFSLSVGNDGTGRVWDHRNDKIKVVDSDIKLSAAALDHKGLVVATQGGFVSTSDGPRGLDLVWGRSWETVVDGLVSTSADQLAVLSGGAIHVCEKTDEWACRAHEVGFAPELLAAGPVEGTFAVASQAQVPTIGMLSALGVAPGKKGPTPFRSQFRGPIGWPVALRYSPDGARVAVASVDGTVWLASASGDGCPLILRHESPLADIAFSGDGSLLATGSFDGDVRVFRVADGAGPVRLAGHRGPVRSVSFLPENAERRILSVSDDGSARVWAAPGAEEFAGLEMAERLCVAKPMPEPEVPVVRPQPPVVPVVPILPASRDAIDVAVEAPVAPIAVYDPDRVVPGAEPGEVCIVGTGPEGFMSGEDKEKQVVKDVCLDITEVTVAAYGRCVASGKCTKPDEGEYCNEGKGGRESHPVNCVDFGQANAYCKWVGKRLPTEWEWEWAARGRDEGRTYPWGEQAPSCARAVMGAIKLGCGMNRTWPVGSRPNGNSRDGFKDMAGSVWEWTSRKHDSNSSTIRGGSLAFSSPDAFRAAKRNNSNAPAARDFFLGFRCARTPPE